MRVTSLCAFWSVIIPFSAAVGQEQSSTLQGVLAAAEYVLSETVLPDISSRTVVDVESGPGLSLNPVGAAATAAATELAVSLGSRAESLASVISCRDSEPVTAEPIGGHLLGSCQFTPNTDLVIQVGEPRIENQRMFVWIAVWRESKDDSGNAMYVSLYNREVMLSRTAEGDWIPKKITREEFGHY